MNVLDQNIVLSERRRLEPWKIPFNQIGVELGRPGMTDLDEIIPLLHKLNKPAFFTRDRDFYISSLRSSRLLPRVSRCSVRRDSAIHEALSASRRFPDTCSAIGISSASPS